MEVVIDSLAWLQVFTRQELIIGRALFTDLMLIRSTCACDDNDDTSQKPSVYAQKCAVFSPAKQNFNYHCH